MLDSTNSLVGLKFCLHNGDPEGKGWRDKDGASLLTWTPGDGRTHRITPHFSLKVVSCFVHPVSSRMLWKKINQSLCFL